MTGAQIRFTLDDKVFTEAIGRVAGNGRLDNPAPLVSIGSSKR